MIYRSKVISSAAIIEFNYQGIYELLKRKGFGYSNITKKGIYFRKLDNKIEITDLKGIRKFFLNWIREEMTMDSNQILVLNECLKKNPINNQRPNKILLKNNSCDAFLIELVK